MTHTPTPWFYRPCRHDDWGWIRGPSSNGEMAPLVACARSGQWESAQMMDDHRAAKTDPYAANAAFIVRAVNSHDALRKALGDLLQLVIKEAWNAEQLPEVIATRAALASAAPPVEQAKTA